MDAYLRSEVLRYAGMGGADLDDVDPRILDFIEQAVSELQSRCRPRFTSKIFSLAFPNAQGAAWSPGALDSCGVSDRSESSGTPLLRFGGVLDVTSRSLTINLADCGEVIFMAATLGTEADMLISRYSRRDMSKGVLMEAAATAVIEEYCDQCQMAIEQELNEKGMTLRPRFSPGYGDFSIEHQEDCVRLLDLPRTIGVTLTDGGMLAPSKSVTALMGIALLDEGPLQSGKEQKQRCHIHGCEACNKTNCLYRRNR